LEHSTIPPYLTALFSLAPNSNVEIRQCLHAIVVQEMAHMTIVGNILVAIGGAPAINTPDFIPEYPGKLPMGIGGSGFVVPIRRFSKQLLRDVFMVIEEPETPIPVRRLTAEAEPQFGTIGE